MKQIGFMALVFMILVFALVSMTAFAQDKSFDQERAVLKIRIAELYLQAVSLGEANDRLTKENQALKAELEAMKKAENH